MIYVSEESAGRIVMLGASGPVVVADAQTPIRTDSGKDAMALTFPEGLAFGPGGELLVVEDRPGGRLVRFLLGADGRAVRGEVVDVPGPWQAMAWEGVAVSDSGEWLLAGSDLESVSGKSGPRAFLGVLLHRDAQGQWWVLERQPFASFSGVSFSRDGRFALYTCEVSGETGWLDLRQGVPMGGCAAQTVPSAEAIAEVPGGRLAVTEESGTLWLIDPMTDRAVSVPLSCRSIESVCWDETRGVLLVTDDGEGRVMALHPDTPLEDGGHRLTYAPIRPIGGVRSIPERCPTYLQRVLALAGWRTSDEAAYADWKALIERVPLVAADAMAEPLMPVDSAADPIERVQFVVFHPNSLLMDDQGPMPGLAGFVAVTRSGRVVKSGLRKVTAAHGGLESDPERTLLHRTAMVVPHPAAVSVSALGMATLHFLGMGEFPDYAILLDPRHPMQSGLAVFEADGQVSHYRLKPIPERGLDDWVIGYAERPDEQWTALSDHARWGAP